MNSFHIGLVGAGGIARDHANSLKRFPNVRGITLFDTDAKRAADLAARDGARVARSMRELVQESDIVWICTPPFGRRDAILEACRARKPIFCEKPLGITGGELAFVAREVRKARVPFFMGQSGRYSDFFVRMKGLVKKGAIGRPTMVWSTRLGYLDPRTAAPWRLDDKLGGGTVIELGVHEIDFMRWIAGEFESVSAVGSSRILVPGKFQDSLVSVGRMTGGVVARLDISWANPRYLWQRGVEGEEGSLFFDDSRVTEVLLNRPGKPPAIFKTDTWQDVHTKENLSLRDQNAAVLKALAKGSKPPVTIQDGAAAVRAALAMRESARTGRMVTLK